MPFSAASIATHEIERFSRYGPDWWDETGPLAPLHRLNPVRLGYIRKRVCAHFGRKGLTPFKGLAALDVGCGGGLVTEPLARLGAATIGLDASETAIANAREHAKLSGLAIDYRIGSIEAMAKGKARFDLITALEIAEHVADLSSFIAALAALLKPNGLLVLSTLNRTPKSFLFGILAAEYILNWVPRGTHEWKKFLRPSELVEMLDTHRVEVTDLTGLVFNPLTGDFELSHSELGVNYLLAATKP